MFLCILHFDSSLPNNLSAGHKDLVFPFIDEDIPVLTKESDEEAALGGAC